MYNFRQFFSKKVATFCIKNESGTTLDSPEFFRLLIFQW